jgi:hypothetical protein
MYIRNPIPSHIGVELAPDWCETLLYINCRSDENQTPHVHPFGADTSDNFLIRDKWSPLPFDCL